VIIIKDIIKRIMIEISYSVKTALQYRRVKITLLSFFIIGMIFAFGFNLGVRSQNKKVEEINNLKSQEISELNEVINSKEQEINNLNKNINNLHQDLITYDIFNFDFDDRELVKTTKNIIVNRIKFIRKQAYPSATNHIDKINNYADWLIKYGEKYNIHPLYFASFADKETHWISNDTYDNGESWTAFSMQIMVFRETLNKMGYNIPNEPNANKAWLHQSERYSNFVSQYKYKLFDQNLDMKELTFDVVGFFIKNNLEQYDKNYTRTAGAYNRGSYYYDSVYHAYPFEVMGRFVYLRELLTNKMEG
jgi:hypothetical protein